MGRTRGTARQPRGQRFTRRCPATGKARHRHPAGAQGQLDELRRVGNDPKSDALEVYRCPACHDWHVGHTLEPPAAPSLDELQAWARRQRGLES